MPADVPLWAMSMFEGDGRVLPARPDLAIGEIDKKVVYGAAIVGMLVNLNALFIPIFQNVGGGLVAGFIAGYGAGRPARGAVWGTIAAAIAGAATGVVFMLNRLVVGIFIEPPSLLIDTFGPISPTFTQVDFFWVLLLYLALVVAVAFDGLLTGAVGGFIKGTIRATFGE